MIHRRPHWRWDAVHRAVFPHQLGAVAALLPFLNRSVPSYREIIDLSPANDSRFLDAVGESGHFLSKHYDDFLDDWRAVRHKKMRMERWDIEKGAVGHLRLTP